MNDSQITQLDLQAMAEQIMLEHGFEPEFPAAVQQQLADIKARSPLAPVSPQDVRDLRGLLWSSIDNHAAKETTTVYTGVRNFPMLPEKLSTGVSSLLESQDRLALVIESVAGGDGNVSSGMVYPALVRNKAQLTYKAVGDWLEGTAAAPPKVAASSELQGQLKLQN